MQRAFQPQEGLSDFTQKTNRYREASPAQKWIRGAAIPGPVPEKVSKAPWVPWASKLFPPWEGLMRLHGGTWLWIGKPVQPTAFSVQNEV